ncbi:MAG: hypothetical protein JWM98_950 [Thermoleophilia bacterium]|nr:hypothetical protein [Thermoleophilia bacterium]
MHRVLGFMATLIASLSIGAPAASAAGSQTIWVDPVHGRDSRSGATKALALRSLTAAWNRIPAKRELTHPVRIMVRAGTIAPTAAPNYWEERWGTAAAPISIVSADGPGRAQLPSINMFHVRHLTLDGVAIRSPFDTFHCEGCSYIELERSAFVGIGDYLKGAGPQEGVKINQTDHLTITDSYLAGATDNALDMVAVQHALIARNTIAHSVDWCSYAKGGSTDVRYDSNDVHHCGTGGITIGQGTGFQFMVAPWTNYEGYGNVVVNNLIHDVDGAAVGVNGAFATLVARNTAYRVGTRDHVLEVVFGERSCDGDEHHTDDAKCAVAKAAGGWGPAVSGGDPAPIGSSQTAILSNLVYNPPGVRSQYTHFAVYAPRDAAGSGGPDPAVVDDGLLIRGNAIWNGPADMELGLGGDQGCADTHPTCAPATVRAENDINGHEPAVRVVAGVAPVPTADIAAGSAADQALPSFDWVGVVADRHVPVVAMPTSIDRDRAGVSRAGRAGRPGAYVGAAPSSVVKVTGLASRGSVTARSGGSAKGAGGSFAVLRGSWLELTARPARGKRFVAWGGACAGQRGTTCVLRAARATVPVTAKFTR